MVTLVSFEKGEGRVMGNIRRISKKYYFRQIVACWLVSCLFCNVPVAFATATGADVVAGSAGVGQAGNTTTVTMGSARAVINWDSLNTSSNEILQFLKANGSFAVLNRVMQGGATQFDGSLFGNQGHIIIVNPRGIVFGPTALVQAHKFTASGLDIANTDFMDGYYQFVGGDGIGTVSNYGEISAEQVALIGRQVLNAGTIRSPGGYVLMAAGDRVFLGREGSDIVVEVDAVTVTDPTNPTPAGMGDVINEGTVEAAGGKIVLAAGDTFSRAIDGLDSLSLAVESGTGRVGQFGTLNADGVDGDGGSITLTAGEVVALGEESVTTANAGANGDGGDVVVYSPGTALFREGAAIEAKGGSVSGDGGFAEVSGMQHVEVFGSVDASATDGAGGTFLIDPTDITIQDGAGSMDPGVGGIFTPSGNTSSVSDDAIEDFLDTGTNVVIDTTSSGTADGDITQNGNAQIDKDAGGEATLTMNADDDIWLYGGIDSDAGALNVILNADDEIYIDGEINLDYGGDITMTALGDITIEEDVRTKIDDSGTVSTSITLSGDNVYINDGVKAEATSDGSGNATAAVTIDATTGYVDIEGDVQIEAIAQDGVTNIATVDIDADEYIHIDSDNDDDVKIRAYAYNGTTNTATIDMYAGEYIHIEADSYSNDDVEIRARAKNGTTNTGTISMVADDYIEIETDGWAEIDIEADAYNEGDPATNNSATIIMDAGEDIEMYTYNKDNQTDIDIEAYAYNGATNEALIDIDAVDYIDIYAYDDDIDIEAKTWDGTTNTSTINVDAGGYLELHGEDGSDSDTEIYASAKDGLTNTANITVNADGYVKVFANDGEAEIEAEAKNGDKNTAGITITAGEDVTVKNENDDEDEVKIQAVAENDLDEDDNLENIENTATVDITAGGIVEVIDTEDGYSSGDNHGGAYIEAKAKNYIDIESDDGVETLTNLKNTATVNITAADVEVISKDSDSWREAAEIVALAENEIWIYQGDADEVDLTLQNIKNDADITITANSDEGEGGDVFVHGVDGGRAQIKAKARNKIIDDADITVDLALNGLENTADIIIDAYDDVKVVAVGYGSGPDSKAKIEAEAENEISDEGDTINLTVDGRVENSAGIDITAGDDALVKGKDQGEAEVKAKAENDVEIGGDLDLTVAGIVENKADITIVAGGDVKVIAQNDGAEAEIAAEAENDADSIQLDDDGVIENTADITITTESGEVLVHGMGYGSASIEALAENAEKNSASVTITANREDCPDCEESDDGYVKVLAVGGSEAYITAEALNSADNDADVTINAAGNVEVRAWNNNLTKAKISAIAENELPPDGFEWPDDVAGVVDFTLDGLDNTASVDITALNVLVEGKGSSEAWIHAEAKNKLKIDGLSEVELNLGIQNLTNDADVTITTILDPTVEMITNVGDGMESGTGNVWVTAEDGGEALIRAKAKNKIVNESGLTVNLTLEGLENTADVVIDADDDVEVTAEGFGSGPPSKAKIRALAENEIIDRSLRTVYLTVNGLVINDAAIDIDAADVGAGSVKVMAEDGAIAKIKAIAQNEIYVHGGMVIADDAVLENKADIAIDAVCNVGVIVENGGNAEISAEARNGTENTADIVINAGGDVKVIDTSGGPTAKIQALANNLIDVLNWDIDTLEGLENIANIDITATNVEVRGEDGGEAYIEADAHNLIDIGDEPGSSALDLTVKDLKNTAGVTITTTGEVDDGQVEDGDGDVLVIGKNGGEADIGAVAFNEIVQNYWVETGELPYVNLTVGSLENKADVVINATGDVAVHGLYDDGEADIDAEAQNMLTGGAWRYLSIVEEQGPITNTATVDITTGDTVEVVGIQGEAKINAEAWNYNENDWAEYGGQVKRWPLPDVFPDVKDNTATILIDAGGDVIVKGGESIGGSSSRSGHAEIEALARYGVNNDATVDIDAVGDVRVTDLSGCCTAEIKAMAEDAIKSNTANILIGSIDDPVGGNVEVIAGEEGNSSSGGKAKILAVAHEAYGDFLADNGDEGDNTATVEIFTDGDVEVTAVEGGTAAISARTAGAESENSENSSDVLICADDVLVQGGYEMAESTGDTAEIKAVAVRGYTNTANVGIGARGDVEVLAIDDGHSSISARAFNPEWADTAFSNDADVLICADGSVLVIDEGGGRMGAMTAEIIAEATFGISNIANVGICADHDADGDGDVLVAADEDGTARIYAEAEADDREVEVWNEETEEWEDVKTSADAGVVVVSHAGSVGVVALSGGHAYIEAEADGAYTNTADVGIAAGKELAPADVPELEEPDVLPEDIDDLLDLLPPGNVVVLAGGFGNGRPSIAGILALATDGVENTADTVVCAPGTVAVVNLDEDFPVFAGIGAVTWEDEGDKDNTATTQIYASDGIVSEGAYVGAVTPEGVVYVTDWIPGEEVPASEGGATLILDDYSVRKDCPDCPPCLICEVAEAWLAAAPLPLLQIPEIAGCPVELAAAASELGIAGGTIQISMGAALALNPGIQPCEACARLIDAAAVLRDTDGSSMTAMNEVFSEIAPAGAPFTPEMAASIVTAFAGRVDDGTAYATAIEYVDAFVQYIAVLDTELGSPLGEGESLGFVMGKYGAGIAGSENSNIAAFVAARLAGMETFSGI